jgi:hypothetical protein
MPTAAVARCWSRAARCCGGGTAHSWRDACLQRHRKPTGQQEAPLMARGRCAPFLVPPSLSRLAVTAVPPAVGRRAPARRLGRVPLVVAARVEAIAGQRRRGLLLLALPLRRRRCAAAAVDRLRAMWAGRGEHSSMQVSTLVDAHLTTFAWLAHEAAIACQSTRPSQSNQVPNRAPAHETCLLSCTHSAAAPAPAQCVEFPLQLRHCLLQTRHAPLLRLKARLTIRGGWIGGALLGTRRG